MARPAAGPCWIPVEDTYPQIILTLSGKVLCMLRSLTVAAKSCDEINIACNGVVADNGVLVPIVVVVVPSPGTVHLESQSDSVV